MPPQPPPIEETRAPRRWRFVPRSLSSRLVAFVVALVLVVVAAAGTATYVALHSFMMDRLSQQLRNTITQGPQIAAVPSGGSTSFHSPQAPRVALLSVDGGDDLVPTPGFGVEALQLSASQRARIVADPGATFTLTSTNGEKLLVGSEQRATVYHQDAVLFVVGLPTDEVSRTLHRLVLLEIAIGALAVAVALVLTSWGVHLSLRPLNRVTRTAARSPPSSRPKVQGWIFA